MAISSSVSSRRSASLEIKSTVRPWSPRERKSAGRDQPEFHIVFPPVKRQDGQEHLQFRGFLRGWRQFPLRWQVLDDPGPDGRRRCRSP